MELDLNKTNGSSPPDSTGAITQLYKEHDPLVRSIIWSHLKSQGCTFLPNSAELSDDLSQEVWLKVATHFRAYQNRGYKVTAWIGKIVKNHMLDWCAKGRNRHRLVPTWALDDHLAPDKDRWVLLPRAEDCDSNQGRWSQRMEIRVGHPKSYSPMSSLY